MPIDVVEYVKLSKGVYASDSQSPDGWELLETDESSSNGFKAAAYKKRGTFEVVISFRGTDNFSNILTDLNLLFRSASGYPDTLPQAKSFVDKIKNKYSSATLSFTGHSLGASIAECMACAYNVSAVTFDSPGCQPLFDKYSKDLNFDRNKITHYLSCPNIINTLNPHLGIMKHVKISQISSQTASVHAAMSIVDNITTWTSTTSNQAKTTVEKIADYLDRAKKKSTSSASSATESMIPDYLLALAFLKKELSGNFKGLVASALDGAWLYYQHALESFAQNLTPENIVSMSSWPTGEELFFGLAYSALDETLNRDKSSTTALGHVLDAAVMVGQAISTKSLPMFSTVHSSKAFDIHWNRWLNDYMPGYLPREMRASDKPITSTYEKYLKLHTNFSTAKGNTTMSNAASSSTFAATASSSVGGGAASSSSMAAASSSSNTPVLPMRGASSSSSEAAGVSSAASASASASSPARASSVKDSLVNTAIENLGWSCDERNRLLSKVFSLKKEDIWDGATEFKGGLLKINNTTEANEIFKLRFGANLDLGMTFLKNIRAGYEHGNQSANQNRNNYIMAYGCWVTPVRVNKGNNSLAITANVNTSDIGSAYIASGTILQGYVILIDATFENKEILVTNSNIDASANFFDKLKAEFTRLSNNTNTANRNEIRITVDAIGDFSLQGDCIKAASFEDDVKKLHEHVETQGRLSKGRFYFTVQDVKKYDQNVLLLPQYNCLLSVAKELMEKFNTFININFFVNNISTVADYEKKVRAIHEELKSMAHNFNLVESRDIQQKQQKLRCFAENLQDIITNLHSKYLISRDSICKIKITNSRSNVFYFGGSGDHICYWVGRTDMAVPLAVEASEEQHSFFLKSDAGTYLGIRDQDSRKELAWKDKNEATKWKMEWNIDTISNQGLKRYSLRTSDIPYFYIHISDAGLNSTPVLRAHLALDTDTILESNSVNLFLGDQTSKLNQVFLLNLNTANEFSPVPSPPVPRPITNNAQYEEFLANIFPKLYSANGKSIVLIIGLPGSGKSLFVNYMCGHTFNDNFEVNDTNKHHAITGSTLKGVTQYPEAYTDGESDFIYLDAPGFEDPDQNLDARNFFSLFLIKEMAVKIKTCIVMLPWAYIAPDAPGRAEHLMRLLNLLQKIIFIQNFTGLTTRITFVINGGRNGESKIVLTDKDSVLNRIKDYLKEMEPEVEELDKSLEQFRRERIEYNDPSRVERLKQFFSSVWARLKFKSEASPEETQKKLAEELEKGKKSVELLKHIHKDNTIFWGSVHNPIARLQFLELMTSSADIPKFCLTFDANSSFANALNQWIYDCYWIFLSELSTRYKSLVTEKERIEHQLDVTLNSRLNYLKNEIRSSWRLIKEGEAYCAALAKTGKFEDIKLPADNWYWYHLLGSWQVKTQPVSMTGFSQAFYYESPYIPKGKIQYLTGYYDNEVENSIPASVSIDAIRFNTLLSDREFGEISAHVENLTEGDIVRYSEIFQRPPLPVSCSQKYSNATLIFKFVEWNNEIPPNHNRPAGHTEGIQLNKPNFRGHFEAVVTYMDFLRNIIKRNWQEIQNNRLSTEEIERLRKKLAQITWAIENIKSELKIRQNYFLKIYTALKPIYQILQKYNVENPFSNIQSNYIKSFIEECEHVYREALAHTATCTFSFTSLKHVASPAPYSDKDFLEIDIPNDGNCLYYAVALGYLLKNLQEQEDETNDTNIVSEVPECFIGAYKNLFGTGTGSEDSRSRFHKVMLRFSGRCVSLEQDEIFNCMRIHFREVIITDFRRRKDFYQSKAAAFGLIPPILSDLTTPEAIAAKRERNISFNNYISRQAKNGVWGGLLEILAMEKLLEVKINIYKVVDGNLMPIHTSSADHETEIKLILAAQSNEGNHYRLLLLRGLLPPEGVLRRPASSVPLESLPAIIPINDSLVNAVMVPHGVFARPALAQGVLPGTSSSVFEAMPTLSASAAAKPS